MKKTILLFIVLFIGIFINVQAQWSTSGNTLTSGDWLGSNNSQPLIFKTNNSEKMRILVTGEVGIGTTNPYGKVNVYTGLTGTTVDMVNQVSGSISFANGGSTTAVPMINGKSNDAVGLFLSAETNNTNTYDMGFGVRENDNSDFATLTTSAFKFLRYATSLVDILRNGNVGIGTTTPWCALDISKADAIFELYNSTSGGNADLYLAAKNAGTVQKYFVIQTDADDATNGQLNIIPNSSTSGNAIVSIESGGNVGIGTTTPANKLHLYVNNSTTSTGTEIIEQDGTGDATLQFGLTSTVNWITGIDNSNSDAFQISTNNEFGTNDRMTITTNGYVGIGTTSPTDHLEVVGSFGIHMATDKNLRINSWDMNSETYCMTIRAVKDNDDNIPLNFAASHYYFSTGSVGIGTVEFGNGVIDPYYKLAVCGSIHATEVVVEANNWCDFVFDKEYNLKSLSEVEQYINENKHLPDVPSADEVAKNGVSLGKSDSVLLQKIEELTLYIIELNKRIDVLEASQQK
jgi:hypothetical protein